MFQKRFCNFLISFVTFVIAEGQKRSVAPILRILAWLSGPQQGGGQAGKLPSARNFQGQCESANNCFSFKVEQALVVITWILFFNDESMVALPIKLLLFTN